MSKPDPSPGILDLTAELLRVQRRRSRRLPGVRLEISAFLILWVLSDGEPRTLRQLTSELELEQSTVNRQVNAAISAGYVERFEVPGSASRYLRPTESGRQAYDHDAEVRANLLQGALDVLGERRAAGLIADLRAFNDAWDKSLE